MLWLVVLMGLGGCASPERGHEPDRGAMQARQIETLRQEKTRLEDEVGDLREQVEVLRGWGEERGKLLVTVEAMELGRFTGGWDENRDGYDEGVKVYVKLRDRDRDVIKGAGAVELEVWDLAGERGEEKLLDKRYGPEEVRARWLSGPMTEHFKFEERWEGGAPEHENLTVKVRYTDLLTGRVFEAQEMITVQRRG